MVDVDQILAELPGALLDRVVGQFVKDTDSDLIALREHAQNGDLPSAAAVAHRLYGGACAIGAYRLAEVSGKLQDSFMRGETASISELELAVRQAQKQVISFKELSASRIGPEAGGS